MCYYSSLKTFFVTNQLQSSLTQGMSIQMKSLSSFSVKQTWWKLFSGAINFMQKNRKRDIYVKKFMDQRSRIFEYVIIMDHIELCSINKHFFYLFKIDYSGMVMQYSPSKV